MKPQQIRNDRLASNSLYLENQLNTQDLGFSSTAFALYGAVL